MTKLFALRGAVCAENTADSITENTVRLCTELFERNRLTTEALVSLQFSVTQDIDALNPCTALRKHYSGSIDIAAIPLFCTAEAAIRGAPERVIRLLMYAYMEENACPIHVYTGGAEKLRPDLSAH